MKIREISILISRVALFVIYFWFGFLKIVGLSPASPMVHNLFDASVGSMTSSLTFGSFIVLFGLFEMLVGILFIIPKMEKVALVLFLVHMITTTLPLFMLSGEVWTNTLVPTLEGQYIIKNLGLVACAMTIWASILPPKHQNIMQ